jgi:indole-3-glycerol phosphate synthase
MEDLRRWKLLMPDFLSQIVTEVRSLLKEGYYDLEGTDETRGMKSLLSAIKAARGRAVIAEVKPSTPTKGLLTENLNIREYIKSVEKAGVVGFSILTQPRYFEGSLNNLREARKSTSLPLLMKDFVISDRQIEAARKLGADAVLLIQGIFDSELSLDSEEDLISKAHDRGLEVLNEVNTADELTRASSSGSDILGINHRNLRTLELDNTLAERLLENPGNRGHVIVAESGVNGPEDARRYFQLGADAILVGSYLMQAEDALNAARLLVTANA